MTTIGDSFSVAAILFLIGLTTWAMILVCSLIFTGRVAMARDRFEQSPVRGFMIGILVLMTGGTLAVTLASIPIPVVRAMGLMAMMAILAIMVLGMSGLSLLIGNRIRVLEPAMSSFGSMNRGAMLLTIASFFPILGWFFLAPIAFVTALGIGTQAILNRGVRIPMSAEPQG